MNEGTNEEANGSDGGTFVTEQAQRDMLMGEVAGTAGAEGAATGVEAGVSSGVSGAPGSYTAFTMPEGIPTDDPQVQSAIDEASAAFKEMGLNQEQAQKLVDLHMKQWVGAAASSDEVFFKRDQQRIDDWGQQTKTHPEFGGANFKASLASALLAIDKLGGADLRKALSDETGIINHPAIFGAFVKIGKLFGEDRMTQGTVGTQGGTDDPARKAAMVYPNMQNSFNRRG